MAGHQAAPKAPLTSRLTNTYISCCQSLDYDVLDSHSRVYCALLRRESVLVVHVVVREN